MQAAAVTTAVGKVEIMQVARPVPSAGEALVRVECVGVCGTDVHIFDGSYATDLPLIQGHEISGVLESLPDDYAGPLQVGDLVAVEPVISCGTCYPCRAGRRNTCQHMDAIGVHRAGGLQTRVAVPVANCHPARDVAPEVAAMCETLSVGLHATTRASVTARDTVLVLGAGPIGLGTVIAARDVGARVMVLDQHPSRRALAHDLGADELVASLEELPGRVAAWTDGDGAAVVVEATGAAIVAERAFAVAATAGRIVMVGVSEQVMKLSVRTIQSKELDVFGSRATLDFPAAVRLAQRYSDDVQKLVSHRFPLAEAHHAIAFTHDNPQAVVKTLIKVS